MKMEAPPSTILFTDDDSKNLEQLLDVFGSVVSLDDIASAYCKAGRDPIIAGDILGDQKPSSSGTTNSEIEENIEDSVTLTSEFEEVGDSVISTSESVSEIDAERVGPRSSKQKKLSVSMGTVSSMIPKDYLTNRPVITETSTRIKPLKLSADDFLTPELREEKAPSGAAATSETLPSSVEEFLFNMLGSGFSLDRSVIGDVVGQCGYDLDKSMDKLLDMSASTLGKSDDIINIGVKKSVESSDFASKETSSMTDPAIRSKANEKTKNGLKLSMKEQERYEIQKEVLHSLFDVPAASRYDNVDEVIRPVKEVGKSSRLNLVVDKPLQETLERQILIRTPQSDAKNGEEDQESYEVLRKAVKEYWITMKEYYNAASEAFSKGDHDQARKFLEEGQFFMMKAQVTDEQSSEKLLETSCSSSKEIVTLDLHDLEPKDAVRLLKLQLTSLCGFSSIQYLKLLVGITAEEAKGPRKRLLLESTLDKQKYETDICKQVLKFLERDSIPWTEEENGTALVIRVDVIDPRKMTFAKKSTARVR